MPLNSVQSYVKGILDGLTLPAPTGQPASTLTAWVTPPTLEDLNGPRAYIWGGRNRGYRQTMPRAKPNQPATGGFKWLDWTIDIYLVYLTAPDDAQIDQEFPLMVDAVLSALWNTTMPVFITDPTTGLESQVLAIGEDWELEYPPERTPATLRMLYYTCRIAMDVREAVQG